MWAFNYNPRDVCIESLTSLALALYGLRRPLRRTQGNRGGVELGPDLFPDSPESEPQGARRPPLPLLEKYSSPPGVSTRSTKEGE